MTNATRLAFLVFAVAAFSLGCKGNLKTNDCVPQCGGKECGSDGCGGICGTCGPGLACGTDGSCVSSFCGNSRLDPGESCDFAITAGVGACETACTDDGDACTTEEFHGNPQDCDAQCRSLTTVNCTNGDDCCPSGCNGQNDSDCSLTCGNGTIEDLETCDPPDSCPTDPVADCPDDMDACTTPVITGNPENCAARCNVEEITEDDDGTDGCCPQGSGPDEDPNCDAVCGDGEVGGNENCDNAIPAGMPGACPEVADCDDAVACTADELVGMADDCSAVCSNVDIVDVADGDGCCPPGATADTDDDCVTVCGDNLVEGAETCDSAIAQGTAGYCPVDAAVDCDDMDACSTDTISGDAATCSAECVNDPIMACVNGDGCCYFMCTFAQDDDCAGLCDDYCTKAATNCQGGDALFTDDNMSGDANDECMAACAAYPFVVGQMGDSANSFDTLWCRIEHLDLAAADAATHCPHALEVSPVCNMAP